MKTRVALAASLVIALAGCSSAEPGAAAVVEGESISTSDVLAATKQISTAFQGQIAPSQVVYVAVVGSKAIPAAAQAGVGVSEQDARDALVQRSVTDPNPVAISAVQADIALSRISALPENQAKEVMAQLESDLKASDISINPRFGSWDPNTLSPGPAKENWLVQSGTPASSPAPTPSS